MKKLLVSLVFMLSACGVQSPPVSTPEPFPTPFATPGPVVSRTYHPVNHPEDYYNFPQVKPKHKK